MLLSLILSSAMATEPWDMEPWEQQLSQQTQIKATGEYANFAAHGYVLMDVAKTSLLDASTSEFVNVNLPLGNDYVVMAVCDNDCLDLDLSIVKSGVELSTDTTEDDWPLVKISPVDTPDYQIKVTMYRCGTPNCGYQVSVWQKPRTPQADAPAPEPPPQPSAPPEPPPATE